MGLWGTGSKIIFSISIFFISLIPRIKLYNIISEFLPLGREHHNAIIFMNAYKFYHINND
jgi:hypothetical protein